MGHFVELVMEALFGLAKESPEEMPEMEYKERFVVKHPRKKTLANLCASLILIGVFLLLWILIKHETRYLFFAFVVLGTVLLAFAVEALSYKCYVDETALSRTACWIFKKKVQWADVFCVRVLEKTKEKTVTICLYNTNGKWIMDFHTGMENAWYAVKMAEHKGIQIQRVRDLPLEKMGRL